MNPTQEELEIWKAEIDQLRLKSQALEPKANLVAFYGSSSIRLWEDMEQALAPHHVINLGFGGSSYRWCDYYFEEVFQYVNPQRIILYAGDNDLGGNTPQHEILGFISSLLSKIKNKYGNIPIGIISVKPSPDRLHLKEKIEQLNAQLVSITNALEDGSYINIYREMLNFDGTLRPELFVEDQLHLNPKGYELWKKVIKDHLDQVANDSVA